MRRRLTLLSVLFLAVSAIKVSEEVIGGESGPIDQAILLFIHGHVPGTLTGFFEAVTFTGSSKVLFPLASVATRSDDRAAVREASTRGAAPCGFCDQRCGCGLRCQNAGRPGAPGSLGDGSILGLQLSQRAYSGRRGIRYRRRSLREPDQACGAQARAVDSDLMDISCRHLAPGAWGALADRRPGRRVHRRVSASGDERRT